MTNRATHPINVTNDKTGYLDLIDKGGSFTNSNALGFIKEVHKDPQAYDKVGIYGESKKLTQIIK